MPTRDNPQMLRRAVDSIRAKTPMGTYRLVLIDNGDAGGPAAPLLAELSRAGDVDVIRRLEPFSYSAFCNDAAAGCRETLLVFLNDDVAVLSDGWLHRLAALAAQPDVGAVGARLTFPDGRLQHVGVLLGMGGSAGHLGAGVPGDDPGWLGRNGVAHEVSAVTGACLAVEREKFEAVGGFDAAHLPIELSDIDLCLKLNARGWQTVIDPAVHLLHEESASRGGATFRRLSVYAGQRATFVERWRHLLRDDPAFHPGLSLYSLSVALG
jgi:O-antigen biosynthesis protein